MSEHLPIVTLPAKTLRERSSEVDVSRIPTADFQHFVDDLITSMYAADGVGIAAPQVGRNERVFIVNEKTGPKAYINPEILKMSEDTQDSEEGCLSVPGTYGLVKRAKKIRFRALNRHGRRVEFDAKGYIATVYQHELDHLNGILFIDRAEKLLQ
jgi:peptide deformylase